MPGASPATARTSAASSSTWTGRWWTRSRTSPPVSTPSCDGRSCRRDREWVRRNVGLGATHLVRQGGGRHGGRGRTERLVGDYVAHYDAHPCVRTEAYPGVPEDAGPVRLAGAWCSRWLPTSPPASSLRWWTRWFRRTLPFHLGLRLVPRSGTRPGGPARVHGADGPPRGRAHGGRLGGRRGRAANAGAWSCHFTAGYGTSTAPPSSPLAHRRHSGTHPHPRRHGPVSLLMVDG